jgi:hypothetical protein
MPTYRCERCLNEFSQKSHYDKHMKRKTPCQNNKDKIEDVVKTIVSDKALKSTKSNIIMTDNNHSTDTHNVTIEIKNNEGLNYLKSVQNNSVDLISKMIVKRKTI